MDIKPYKIDKDKEFPKRFGANDKQSSVKTHFIPSIETPSVINANSKKTSVKELMASGNDIISNRKSSVPISSPSYISVRQVNLEQETKI